MGGVSYSPEATALFARMSSQPGATRKAVINACIESLISAGVWTRLDALYLLAAHDAQAARLNWKQALYDCTAVNSPTFTTDRGYAGNGTTSYLNTGYTPSTAGGALTLNSAHLSLWNRTARAAAGTLQAGASGSGGDLELGSRFTGDLAIANINDSSAITAAVTDNVGHVLVNRSTSSARQLYKNGASIGSNAGSSNALPTLPVFIGGRNVAGALSLGSTDQIAAASLGGSLNSTEQGAFYSALLTYLTAIGAQ